MRTHFWQKGDRGGRIREDKVERLLIAARPDVPPMGDAAARQALDRILASGPLPVERPRAGFRPAPRLAYAGLAFAGLALAFGASQFLDHPDHPAPPSRPAEKIATAPSLKTPSAAKLVPTAPRPNTRPALERPTVNRSSVPTGPAHAGMARENFGTKASRHPARLASVTAPRREGGHNAAHRAAARPPDAELSQVLVVTATPTPIDVTVNHTNGPSEGYARVAVYEPDGGAASECTIVRDASGSESVRYATQTASEEGAETPYLSVEVTGNEPAPEAKAPEATTPETPQPVTAKPEAAPVETAPVETAPVEAAPVETAPVEAAPVETAPVETAPVAEDAAPQPSHWNAPEGQAANTWLVA